MAFGFGFGMPRSFAVPPFSPASLFTGGIPGVWYDPGDYGATGTLFQDSAGTTPVTAVEQPVGLMLDKSQGLVLGSELVVNGDFSSGTGWSTTNGWSISGGNLNGVAATNSASQNSVTTAGVWHKVSFNYNATLGNVLRICNTSGTALISFTTSSGTSGTLTGYFFATGSTILIEAANAPYTGTIDNFSIRALAGNHAFQSTSASRPVLSARYNLLTKTEQFDDAAWTKTNTTVTANTTATTDPLGGNTADKIVETSANGIHAVRQGNLTTVATNYTFSAYLKAAERTWVLFNADTVGGASGYAEVYVDLTNGTFGTQAAGNGYTIVSKSITSAGNGWWLVSLTYTATSNAGAGGLIFLATGNGTNRYTGNGTSGIYTWGAQLVATNSLTSNAYQRVNTSTDYATTGFLPYLKFDGVDDSLSTNSINFTSTDKMSVFAGVRKLSDAAIGMVAEISGDSNSNNGTFFVAAPVGATTENYGVKVRGNIAALAAGYAPATYTSPITNVVDASLDLSGSTRAQVIIPRVNGIVRQGDPDANTLNNGGNFGNYPLFIGRRNNASLPFNGQLYSMVIVGKAVNAVELTSTEDYIAEQTGVTIA